MRKNNICPYCGNKLPIKDYTDTALIRKDECKCSLCGQRFTAKINPYLNWAIFFLTFLAFPYLELNIMSIYYEFNWLYLAIIVGIWILFHLGAQSLKDIYITKYEAYDEAYERKNISNVVLAPLFGVMLFGIIIWIL